MWSSRIFRFVFVLFLTLIIVPTANADFAVSVNSGSCADPSVAVGNDDLARVVWTSNESGYQQIYWGAFDADGNRIHGPVRVNTVGSHSYRPRLALDAQNRTFLIWIVGSRLHFARLGADGAIEVADMTLNIVNGDYKRADIDVTADGIVHLIIEHVFGYVFYVYYAVCYPDGSEIGHLRVSDRDTYGWEKYPTISVAGDGSATMVWFDSTNMPVAGLFEAQYTAMGQEVYNHRIYYGLDPSYIALAKSTTAGPRILFQNRVGGIDRIRRFVSDTDIPVVSPAPGSTRNPRLAGAPGQPTVAAWSDGSTGAWRIRGAQWDLSGNMVESDLPISDSTGNATKPDIATGGGGLYFITWVDSRNGGNDIYLDTMEIGVPGEWPEVPGPSMVFRVEEDSPGQVKKLRLCGTIPGAKDNDSKSNGEKSIFPVDTDVIGGFGIFNSVDLGFSPQYDIDRVDLLGAGDELLGHIGLEYSWLDYFDHRSVDAYLFLHSSKGPVDRSDYPDWSYYEEDEYQVSMLVPPEGDFNSIGGPQSEPNLFVHGINAYYGSWLSWDDMPDQVDPGEYDNWRFFYPYDQELSDSEHLLGLAIKRVLGDESHELYGCTPYESLKINLVAHSMGGLIARGHIANEEEYGDNIRKLLMFGTPNHGSHISFRLHYEGDGYFDVGDLAELANISDPESPAHVMMSPASKYLFQLNMNPLPRLGTSGIETDYLVIAGTDGEICQPILGVYTNWYLPNREIHHQSDGVVAVSSASLLNEGVPLALVDIDHNCMKFESDAAVVVEKFLSDAAPSTYPASYISCFVAPGTNPACIAPYGEAFEAGILELRIPQGYTTGVEGAKTVEQYVVETEKMSNGHQILKIRQADNAWYRPSLKRRDMEEDYFFSRILKPTAPVLHREIGFWGDEGNYSVQVFHPTRCGLQIRPKWHNVATDNNAFTFKHLETTTAEIQWDSVSELATSAFSFSCLNPFGKALNQYSFTVDSDMNAVIFSLASGVTVDDFSGHGLLLEDPTGRIIDPDAATTDPLISFSVAEQFGPAQFQVLGPMPGVWQIRHEDIIPDPQVVAFYIANFQLAASVANVSPVEGDTLQCEFKPLNTGECLATEVVAEVLFTQPESTESVSMGALDLVVGVDGIFHGSIPDAVPGAYYFDITASCDKSDGTTLERETGLMVPVERALDDFSSVRDDRGSVNKPSTRNLLRISPNPFNASTTLRFAVPGTGHVKIEVYSLDGRRVTILADRVFDAGEYEATWHGRDAQGRSLSSGVYFFRIETNGYVETQKTVILK